MKKGISLIVLIITIIVIIILAGAVILSLVYNNPIEQANEAKFKENVKNYQTELTLWLSKKYVDTNASIMIKQINATYLQGEYEDLKIQDIITSMKDNHIGYTEDATKFSIKEGELIYSGASETEKEWAHQVGIGDGTVGILDTIAPNVHITGSKESKKNVTLKQTITMLDNEGGSGVDLSASKYVVNEESNLYGINNERWMSENAFTAETEEITIATDRDTTYFVHVLTVDKAGNKKETVSEGIKILNDTYVSAGLAMYFDGRDAPKLITGKYYWVSRIGSFKAEMKGFGSVNGGASGSGYNTLTKEYIFDGIDDCMGIGVYNPERITVEIVANVTFPSKGVNKLVANVESGGFAIHVDSNKNILVSAYISQNAGYSHIIAPGKEGVYQTVSGMYDTVTENLYIDGLLKKTLSVPGTLAPATVNTWWYIGNNPVGSNPNDYDGYTKMKVQSVRIYNRALTETEIVKNYEADRSNFYLK